MVGDFRSEEAVFGDFKLPGFADPFAPDVFICKLSSDGTVLWARRLGGIRKEFARSIAVGPHGDSELFGRQPASRSS